MLTLSTRKIRKTIINLIILLFFIHGLIYYFFSQDIYNLNSNIKLIKYVLLIILYIFLLKKVNIKNFVIYASICIFLLLMNVIALDTNFRVMQYLLYIIPISIFCFKNNLKEYINIDRLIKIIYIVASIFGYVEYILWNDLFTMFSNTGFRLISIFINPTNAGAMFCILSIYLIFRSKIKDRTKVLIVFNSALLIFLTGSKGSMVLFGLMVLYCILLIIKRLTKSLSFSKKSYILFISITIVVIFFILVFNKNIVNLYEYILNNSRDISKISFSSGRDVQIMIFFQNITNPIFPCRTVFMYVDNIYLHVYASFGILVLIIYIFMNVFMLYLAVKQKNNFNIIMTIFFIGLGLGENFLYTWPISYIYWYYVGIIFSNKNKLSD